MDNTLYQCFAPCPRGLESALRQELEEVGISVQAQTDGGVFFEGALETVYRANLESRLASRILLEIAKAPYRSEQDVYKATHALPWPTWFHPSRTIKVKVSARHCPLKSLDFATLRIKDAVCDKFTQVMQTRPTVDTHRPDIRIDAFLDATHLTLYLDTSGEPLFKRGFRVANVEAPLRENLAAGLLRLAGWTPNEVLVDPMCGSGTIPLEAALIARGIAPGLSRSFAFEHLLFHEADSWNGLRDAARMKQRSHAPAAIWASDRDAASLQIAQRTFQGAGVAGHITVGQRDLFSLEAPAESGVIVMNPPYGIRLSRPQELDGFYRQLGDWLKKRFTGWRAYIFTGDLRVPKLIGLTPSKRVPLYNGAIECRLYEFHMVSGSMRKKVLRPPTSRD
jgi:putative N6-adenine-specific DNA methylase